MQSYRLHITGLVYKTGFRYYLKENATRMNITGCVFYLPYHSAGAVISGEETEIRDFISLCKSGYPESGIRGVEITPLPAFHFESFEVLGENETENQILKKYYSII